MPCSAQPPHWGGVGVHEGVSTALWGAPTTAEVGGDCAWTGALAGLCGLSTDTWTTPMSREEWTSASARKLRDVFANLLMKAVL